MYIVSKNKVCRRKENILESLFMRIYFVLVTSLMCPLLFNIYLLFIQ